jgi:hypothetical protein
MTNGLTWVGVTDVSKIINPGEGLLNWANKVGREGKTLNQARKQGLGDGRTFHTFTERVARGDDPAFLRATLPSRWPISGFIDAFTEWWEQTRPEVLHAEVNVAWEEFMVRGRVDLVRRCTVSECYCHGEGGWLVDYKTGGHRLYAEAHVQIDGYLDIWPHCDYSPRHLCGAELVTLKGDGTWQLHEPLAPRGTFQNALWLWRGVDAIRNEENRRAVEGSAAA